MKRDSYFNNRSKMHFTANLSHGESRCPSANEHAVLRKTSFCICLIVLGGFAARPSCLPAADLQVGIATIDITPPLDYRMSGYFHERCNTGTHDPLQAKAIVFEQGDTKAALVFCDIIAITLDVSKRTRQIASTRTGIPAEHIAIAATHSHTGPLYHGVLRNRFHEEAIAKLKNDPHETIDYPTALVDKLAIVIQHAQQALRPVHIRAGMTQQHGLSFNRRFHMKKGPVRFNPGVLNPDIVRVAGPIDPEVGILAFEGTSAKSPFASLTVFALHLDTTGGTLYSADFPYYFEQSLRAELGGNFVSIFGNGTCGDINHLNFLSKAPRLKTRTIGEGLAATVLAKWPSLKRVEKPSLAVRSEVVTVPLQKFSEEDVTWAEGYLKDVGNPKMPFLERVKACTILDLQLRGGDTVPLEVQVFRLNNEVAIVTLPGEIFVDLGLAIKKMSPFAQTMVVALTNDCPGYIPTKKAFSEGSYETVNSRVQPGGGERLVEIADRLLNQLKQEIK